jgi:tetratricopeptide (TPR) repeat protein
VSEGVDDPQSEGALEVSLAWEKLFAGDIAASLAHDLAAARAEERAGNLRAACKHRAGAGYEQLLLGDYEAAVETLGDAIRVADVYDLALVSSEARHNLGLALAYLGRLEQALDVERQAIRAFSDQGDLRMAGACHAYASIILELSNDLEGAEREAAQAVELFRDSPANLAYGEARLASVRLGRGDVSGALEPARHAMSLLEELQGLEDGEQHVRLAYAEALHAAGPAREAQAAIARARDALLTKAARIQDDGARARYLQRVPENRKTLALAEVWLGT